MPRKDGAAPYTALVFPALSERLTAHLEHELKCGDGRDADFVVSTPIGRPLSQRNVARALAAAAEAAGLGKVSRTTSGARSARSPRSVASMSCRPLA